MTRIIRAGLNALFLSTRPYHRGYIYFVTDDMKRTRRYSRLQIREILLDNLRRSKHYLESYLRRFS